MSNMAWAAKLAEILTKVSADYQRLRAGAEGTSPEAIAEEVEPAVARAAATAAAAQALTQIVLALDQVPELKGQFREGPIPDLLAALDDVRRGRRSDFFTPWPQQHQPTTSFSMLKLRAVASVHTGYRAGLDDTRARDLVAKTFSQAGHRGKKKGPISTSTVFDWCGELEPSEDGSVEQRIIADTLRRLPKSLSLEDAKRLIRAEAAKRP